MPWGRLDDRANANAKLLALSDSAWRMWGGGLIFCQFNLTDGFIPESAIHAFGVRAKNKQAIADELCRVLVPGKGPCWHRVEGGFRIHDYLDWNDSKDDIERERELSRVRLEKHRTKRVSNGAQNGDETHSVHPSTTTTTVSPQKPAERPPRARGAGNRNGLLADSISLDHGECLAHGPVCFRPHMAAKYIGRFGGDHSAMVAWARRICEHWRARVDAGERPPHGDDFKFWAAAYDAEFGAAADSRIEGPQVPGTDETAAYLATLRSARR